MSETFYTDQHEWIRPRPGEPARSGISNYAQDQLGDIVFVELPEPGRAVKQGEEIAVVESVKAASEVYAPVSGTITAVNGKLTNDPALVNGDAEGEGWFFEIMPENESAAASLMDADAYRAFLDGQSQA